MRDWSLASLLPASHRGRRLRCCQQARPWAPADRAGSALLPRAAAVRVRVRAERLCRRSPARGLAAGTPQQPEGSGPSHRKHPSPSEGDAGPKAASFRARAVPELESSRGAGAFSPARGKVTASCRADGGTSPLRSRRGRCVGWLAWSSRRRQLLLSEGRTAAWGSAGNRLRLSSQK